MILGVIYYAARYSPVSMPTSLTDLGSGMVLPKTDCKGKKCDNLAAKLERRSETTTHSEIEWKLVGEKLSQSETAKACKDMRVLNLILNYKGNCHQSRSRQGEYARAYVVTKQVS